MLHPTRTLALVLSFFAVYFFFHHSNVLSPTRVSTALAVHYPSRSKQTPTTNAFIPVATDQLSSNSRRTTRKTDRTTTLKTLVISRSVRHDLFKHIPQTSYKDASTQARGNSGNFLWHFAAQHRLLDISSIIWCEDKHDDCVFRHNTNPSAAESRRRVVHFYPSANMFYDMSQDVANPSYVNISAILHKLSRLPPSMSFFLIGVGAQSEFHPSKAKSDLGSLPGIATGPHTHVLTRDAVTLFEVLQKRNETTFFRGRYTNAVAQRYGYTHGVVTGCPSLMVSMDVHLGQTLEKRYNEIAARVGDRTLKLAINIVNKKQLNEMYFNLLDKYPNAVVFAQHATDLHLLQRKGVPFHRVRFFTTDVEAWREEMKTMDASIGSRIHGSMIALSVGVPVFVIAPDHRVLELVDVMRVPHTDIFDRRLLDFDYGTGDSDREVVRAERIEADGKIAHEEKERSLDVAALFRDAKFDGKRFDENRCRIAKTYRHVLNEIGIEVAVHVKQIADIC